METDLGLRWEYDRNGDDDEEGEETYLHRFITTHHTSLVSLKYGKIAVP